MKNLDPMTDIVFKALFGKEDKISKELLKSFLNDVLEASNQEEIIDIIHLNPFNYKEFEADKLSVLDIKAKTDSGQMVNIEVQVKKEDNFRKRSLYYWAKAYGEMILESETYESLKKTIVINVLGYIEIVENERLHSIFKIMEHKDHFELLDDFQIHYLELPKLPKKEIEELDKIELWLEFLKEAGKEESEERIKKLKERSRVMEIAVNKLQEISSDERMREIYRAREKARLDMVSKLKYAENKGMQEGRQEGIQEGMQKGIQEGRQKGMQEAAKKLLGIGLPLEQIRETTGLGMDEIERLKRELSN